VKRPEGKKKEGTLPRRKGEKPDRKRRREKFTSGHFQYFGVLFLLGARGGKL